MNCERVLEVLDLTVGGTVEPAEVGVDAAAVRAAQEHASRCAPCSDHRDALRATAAALAAALPRDAAGDEALVARVMDQLPRGRVRLLRRPAVAAAAAILLAAASFGAVRAMSRGGSSRPDLAEVAAASGPGYVPGYAGPHFVDVTADSGLAGVDHTGRENEKDWMVEMVGHGAAAFDMDGDGDLDLFVPDGNRLDPAHQVSGTWRLYRNDGGMRFTDVTAGSGLECDAWACGAVAGDLDGDRATDLFVACFGKSYLFKNLGGGKFRDVTEKAGVAGQESDWATAACLVDVDGDGALDLFVSNYADMRRFIRESLPRGCKWRDMPVACGPQPLEPQRNHLYLNRGDGTFADVGAERLPNLRRYSFQCVAFDANGDGAPDIFVATDGVPNLLLVNDGHGRFVEQANPAGCATDAQGHEQACMGVAEGDVDGDGLPDLFVTNFSHEPNVLYRSRASGGIPKFTDVTAAAGLIEPQALLGWGATFLDFDSDGALDVLFANGHLYPGVENYEPTTSYRQPLSLYRNGGTGRFSEITASAGRALVTPRAHRGLVVADFDDDGRLDAFVTVLNGPSVLLRNDGNGAGHWLTLSLHGRGGVEPAGARVAVTFRGAAGERTVVRDLVLGSSFASSEDPRIHVGLGDATRAERVEIRLPFGEPLTLGPLEADHAYSWSAGDTQFHLLR